MKKIILMIAAAVLSAGIMSAQSTLAEATEIFNQGAQALQSENNTGALELFQKALSIGESLDAAEDGVAELVGNCKDAISKVSLAVAKGFIKDSKYDDAIAKLKEVASLAENYGIAEIATEAKELLPQVMMQKGNDLLGAAQSATDAAAKKNGLLAAATAYKEAYQADSTNGTAALRLGQVLSMTGYADEALDAFKAAAANGQAAAANKQVSTLYLRQAAAALKDKDYSKAISLVDKSEDFGEVNPQAYMVAGQAAQKLNKVNDAIKYFNKYLAASPNANNANAITFTVAALYQQAGNKAKAIEYYQKVASDAKFGAQAKQMIDALKR